MKAKHKKAAGGRTYYSGGESKVAKEAQETEQPMKRGGAVKKDMGKMSGDKGKKRMDRKPHRASGGRVSSDKSPMAPGAATHPFSSAAK